MTGFFKGFSYVLKGITLVSQKGIRPFVLVPLIINTIIFSLGIWFATSQVDSLLDSLLPSWLSWLEWLLVPVFVILIFFATFYTFTIVANLLAAPFNAILSERVEARLHNRPVPEFQGYKTLPAIISRTFRSEAQKLMYMLKWFVVLLIITFIPVVNVISPFAWAFFGAWMLAVEYIDYPMGNHELYFQDELKALKRHRTYALGFGGTLSAMTLIPFVNFFVMPIAVAGATAFWVDRLANECHS